uniref:DUF4352 domain-containing protein n=1 Tax=Rhodothermus marinus TaxID=29549 RepID=A0A7V2AZT8_RHOMR
MIDMLAPAVLGKLVEYGMGKLIELSGKELKLALTIEQVLVGNDGKALLALVTVTNRSGRAVSVDRFELDLGGRKFLNVRFEEPPRILDAADSCYGVMGTRYVFDGGPFEGFREPPALPPNLYLQPGESRTGVVLFDLGGQKVQSISRLVIRAHVGGYEERPEAVLL